MPGSFRVERVRELLKRELSEIIRRELPLEEVGLINIHELDLTKDLHEATVYVGVIGKPSQREAATLRLGQMRKHLQCLLGRSVVLKHTPILRFVMDDSVQRGNRVLQIMEELEQSSSVNAEPPQNP